PSNLQYVLIVPSVLQSISPQRLCVQLYNLSEPLSLNVHLEYHGINTTLFEESVTENNFFQCREFKASLATSDPLAFIIFSAKGHTVHLSERRSVAIQNVDSVVFIQTDKPIYKPGQTGEWGQGYELIIELGVWMSGGRRARMEYHC
uniref:Uncharacterized protein n=1 Tax=Gopherus agassizii TaxID=38772 RepID=A0A452I592_9SAUR